MGRWVASAIRLTALLTLWPLAALALDDHRAAPFDRPLQTKRISLGPSASSKDQNNELRCISFRRVMVKEIDNREIGDDQIATVPLGSAPPPRCEAHAAPGERVISTPDFPAYFLGIKGDFVFLQAADGVDSGLEFTVQRSTGGEPVFRDSVRLEPTGIAFQSVQPDGTGLRLKYTRTYLASCSVPSEGTGCWTRIAAATNLSLETPPDCAAGYQSAKRNLAIARCAVQRPGDHACVTTELRGMADWDASPSVIGYDVEASLQPPQSTIKPAGGPVTCWPAD